MSPLTAVVRATGRRGHDGPDTIYDDGKQTLISYDSVGRMLASETYTKGATFEAGNLRTRREYDYLHSGVVNQIVFTDNRPDSVGYSHVFGYDQFLRRTSCLNELDSVECRFTYNDRGLMESETMDLDPVDTQNPDFTTGYQYDVMGRVAEITYPTIDGEDRSVKYGYTDRGELQTINYPSSTNANQLVETRSYDPGGRMTGVLRPAVNETRVYDDANRLTSLDNDNGIGTLSYGYDANGNKTSEAWTNGPASMSNWDFAIDSYDAEDRFLNFERLGSGGFTAKTNVSIVRSSGSNSTIGNALSVNPLTGDGGLELTGTRNFSTTSELLGTGNAGSLPQVYNDEGQMTTTHTGIGLGWNAAGHLRSAAVTSESTAGIEGDYSYGYDCDGRRV